MAIIAIDWNPPAKTLRQFGWLCPVFFPIPAWAFSGRPMSLEPLDAWRPVAIAFAIGLVIAITGQIRPSAIKPVFLGLVMITFPIGLVVSEILFAVMFFFIFLPVGLVFRLIGRDAMARRFEPDRQTYWQPKRQPANVGQYFKQY